MTRVRIFSGPTAQADADLAKNVLEQAGISSEIAGSPTLWPLENRLPSMYLWVPPDDAEDAVEILKDYFDTPQPDAQDETSA